MQYPGCDDSDLGVTDGKIGREAAPDRIDDARPELLRTVRADLQQSMVDARVAEAPPKGCERLIDLAVVERKHGTGLVPEQLEFGSAVRVEHRLGDRGVAAEETAVGEQRVTGVEQPEFAPLEGCDIVDEPGTDPVPVRASRGEFAAEYPLAEGFGNHRYGIRETGQLAG